MQELPRSLKLITVWLLLGLVLFLGIQAWQHHQAQTRFRADGDTIEIQRGADGHYHWPGTVNGRSVDFLIDTGATGTAISAGLAQELGLASLGTVHSTTAGGLVTGSLVIADVQLRGGVQADRLRVVALPGLGDRPLLGMDVLGRLRWSQAQGVLRNRCARRALTTPPHPAPRAELPAGQPGGPMHNGSKHRGTATRGDSHVRREQLHQTGPRLRLSAGPGQERGRRPAQHRPLGGADAEPRGAGETHRGVAHGPVLAGAERPHDGRRPSRRWKCSA